MGVWGGKNGTLFPHYPEMTKAAEAASDHAAGLGGFGCLSSHVVAARKREVVDHRCAAVLIFARAR